MRCFETLEIHPQGPAEIAALARAEDHASRCESCAVRLSDLREADAALASGLLEFVNPSLCPTPEDLAVWFEAGRSTDDDASREVVLHLSACSECRADFLELVVEDDASAHVVAAPSSPAVSAPRKRRASARVRRPSGRLASPSLLPWAAAAAGILTVILVGIGIVPTTGPSTAMLPVQPLEVTKTPTPVRVAPARLLPTETPVEAPVETTQPSEPNEAPSEPNETPSEPSETPSEPSETPSEPNETPNEPNETPNEPNETPNEPSETPNEPSETPNEPSKTPNEPNETPNEPNETPNEPNETPNEPSETPNEPSEPEPTPTGDATPAPLKIAAADGLYVRSPAQRRFMAFQAGEIPSGSVLRAANGGALLDLSEGSIYLAQGSELRWGKELALTKGQVLLEGRSIRVSGLQGEVAVRGRALIEVRNGKLGLRVLAGEARWVRGDESQRIGTGDVLMAQAKGAARVGRAKTRQPGVVPAWARKLRTARGGPRGPGSRGGPGARGGRGGKTGGGQGGRRGGGRPR